MTEPTTTAGRALRESFHEMRVANPCGGPVIVVNFDTWWNLSESILAIEREAAAEALDTVVRIARAALAAHEDVRR